MLPELFPDSPDVLANVNGEIMPLSDVRISPLDRGFLFGDAVYEVLRIYGGKLWLADEHFRRLQQSLQAIRIEGSDLARLRRRVEETLRRSGCGDGIAYLQITRGAAAPRKHPFPKKATPLELIYVQPFADPYAEARETGACVITTPEIRWQRCDIKSTNLLANVLASQAAAEEGCVEAIFCREDGRLTEGSHANFFGVREGAIVTAPKSNAILPGITRTLIVRLAQEAQIPLTEAYLKKQDLAGLSEAFLSGTTTEVMPVIQVDDQPIGTGKPGSISRRLQQTYREKIAELC